MLAKDKRKRIELETGQFLKNWLIFEELDGLYRLTWIHYAFRFFMRNRQSVPPVHDQIHSDRRSGSDNYECNCSRLNRMKQVIFFPTSILSNDSNMASTLTQIIIMNLSSRSED